MKNIRYTVMLFSLMLLVVLSIGVSVPVLADDTRSYYYDYINVDINVLQNGNMEITEIQKLDYKSGDFHYAYRWIPADRVEDITDVSVSEQGPDYQPNSSVEDWIKER
jgi:hypothetical protein